ncbi:MAG: adenosine kinase [Pseudomonadota bacterium]
MTETGNGRNSPTSSQTSTGGDRLHLVGIGNALVDVLSRVEDAFLSTHGVEKGVMQLIDTERAEALYGAMPPATEVSGGSGANTIVGAAQMGLRAGYIAKVRDDQLGRIFAHDIRAAGVRYPGPIVPVGARDDALATGRCLICVTPDGERSMNTYLGISTMLESVDLDEAMLERTDWLYLEGYLFDTPEAKEAYARAIAAVRRGGGRIAFTCSDPFCIARHRDDMNRLIDEHVDLLFANKAEALALVGTEDEKIAAETLSRRVELAVITLSEDGALVRRGEHEVRAAPQAVDIVDATGAGDLFAAGFLAGLVQGLDDARAAHMGNTAAAHIITRLGPRSATLRAAMAQQAFPVG